MKLLKCNAFYLTTIYSFSNIGECVICTWDPGLEEVHEFEKRKRKRKKVPESKPKGLKIEKNQAQTLKTIENLPTNKQVLRETLNPKKTKPNQSKRRSLKFTHSFHHGANVGFGCDLMTLTANFTSVQQHIATHNATLNPKPISRVLSSLRW